MPLQVLWPTPSGDIHRLLGPRIAMLRHPSPAHVEPLSQWLLSSIAADRLDVISAAAFVCVDTILPRDFSRESLGAQRACVFCMVNLFFHFSL